MFDLTRTRAKLADFISPELAERRQKAFVAAYIDPLTGIGNKRALAEAMEDHKGFAIVFFDVDGFKAVNDSLGHQVGDQLVRFVAASLESTAERFECMRIFRYGGDEFVALISHYQAIAFRDQVEADFLHHILETESPLSVSLSGGIGNTLHEADTAMYQRKCQKKSSPSGPTSLIARAA